MAKSVKAIVMTDKVWLDGKRQKKGEVVSVSPDLLENMAGNLAPATGNIEVKVKGEGELKADPAPRPAAETSQERHEILRKVAQMNGGKVELEAANAFIKSGGKKFTQEEIEEMGYGG